MHSFQLLVSDQASFIFHSCGFDLNPRPQFTIAFHITSTLIAARRLQSSVMENPQRPEDVPALPPPDGVHSNFVNPPSLNEVTFGIGILSLAIMTISVGVRTYTKAVILKEMQHEDC